jgi:hypothetical protein
VFHATAGMVYMAFAVGSAYYVIGIFRSMAVCVPRRWITIALILSIGVSFFSWGVPAVVAIWQRSEQQAISGLEGQSVVKWPHVLFMLDVAVMSKVAASLCVLIALHRTRARVQALGSQTCPSCFYFLSPAQYCAECGWNCTDIAAGH